MENPENPRSQTLNPKLSSFQDWEKGEGRGVKSDSRDQAKASWNHKPIPDSSFLEKAWKSLVAKPFPPGRCQSKPSLETPTLNPASVHSELLARIAMTSAVSQAYTEHRAT